MQTGDGLIGILLAAVGITVFWYANGFPNTSGTYYGPALVPQIVGIGLAICGTIFLGRGARARSSGHFAVGLISPFNQRRAIFAVGLVLASIAAFVFLSDAIGFQVIVFLTLLIGFLRSRGGIIFCSALALTLTVLFDLVFRVFLKVPLPSGPLLEVLY